MFKFSLGRKKEEPGVQPAEAEKEQKRDTAVSDPAAYAESVTPVPAVELIPPRWSRRRIISMEKDVLGWKLPKRRLWLSPPPRPACWR